MENKSHAIAAGAFVLLVTALLVAMAIWLTRDTSASRLAAESRPTVLASAPSSPRSSA